MIVFAKKTFEFVNDGEKKYTKYNELVELPDWVKDTPTFKLAVESGDIIISESKQDEKIINKVAIGETPKVIEVQPEESQPEESKNDTKSKSSTNNKK